MKRLHLICNAHLDPVWQWEWEEGAAETLSTFRIAADFCEEYGNFVFCHNEALLYQWIEEYDPPLFEHIKKLVAEEKWHIMGGWHLQPDCNMPNGESFVRQALSGRRYFKEKFGVTPRVAVNLDPFGHSRGLVQILKKSGYDGYLFMRPNEHDLKLPASEFKWIGYDGSEVVGIRIHGGYNSGKGAATAKIRQYIDLCGEDDFFLCLWGIGNHGGGPSKKDLDDIDALTAEMAEQGVELVQSTPEAYLDEVLEKRELPQFADSLNSWAPGCYTSQVRIKQKMRAAENAYFMAEMMCTHAAEKSSFVYPKEELAAALYDILTIQFHDTLPGSSIQPAEEMSMRMLDHALEILSRLRARAFFALAAGQEKAPSDRIPVFAYNPYPYPVEGDFMCEFMLWDQVWDKCYMKPTMYDAAGNIIPTQCEKEYSNIPIEWRKRVIFSATLAPMTMNRFHCAFEKLECKDPPSFESTETHICFNRPGFEVEINRTTGLVDRMSDGVKEYVKAGAYALEVFADCEDPWMQNSSSWTDKIGQFRLLTSEEATAFCCVKAPIEPVRVIESGSVRTVVEALFGYNTSRAVVKYIISESGRLEMEIRICWDEKQKMVKLNVPAAFATTACIGEHAYGRETLKEAQKENVSQRYIILRGEDAAIMAANCGTYGSSYDETSGELKLTLLRSAAYCAHPIFGRDILPQDRYMPYIEQGERDFRFFFEIGAPEKLLETAPRAAQHFNMAPMVLSFYPTGIGTLPTTPIQLDGSETVQITAVKHAEVGDDVIIRLFNPTEHADSATLSFRGMEKKVEFAPFEIKTFRCNDSGIADECLMEGFLD